MICVDEKPSIQAVERAQGYLKFPNGRALSGQSHDYKRHGTSTLFAALEVATGKVITCKILDLRFQACRMKSRLAIHLLAASLARGSMLSRMHSTGCAGASKARVLDNIESASPIMPAVE